MMRRRHPAPSYARASTLLIGLLAAYVGPKYFAQLGKSEVVIARAQVFKIEQAVSIDVKQYCLGFVAVKQHCMCES